MSNSRLTVATHILTFLAMGFDEPITSEAIAKSVNTNPVVIRRILANLRKANMVASQPGVGGGVHLTRAPQDITLLDVYRVVAEPEVFPMHPNPPDPACPCGGSIQAVLRPVYDDAETAMTRALKRVTIADIARDSWSVYHEQANDAPTA